VVNHRPVLCVRPGRQVTVISGATDPAIEGDTVVARPALAATAIDVMEADGYPCLEATVRRPYGLYVHGSSDTSGAVRAVEAIAHGLGWGRAQAPVSAVGGPSQRA
jgi:hypothetical protein